MNKANEALQIDVLETLTNALCEGKSWTVYRTPELLANRLMRYNERFNAVR